VLTHSSSTQTPATSLNDGRGALGTTTTMTTTARPMGGRENTDNFAGYVNKDDDDNPIGGRGGTVVLKKQCKRRMEKNYQR
jgi:hypothetical protein